MAFRPIGTGGASGSNSNEDRDSHIRQEQQERLLESGNDSLTDALHSKVSKIKHVSIRMQDDVESQNSNQVKRTATKLQVVMAQPHTRQTLAIAGGMVVMFLLFIFWSRNGRFTRPPT
ncbi:hypothetical protein BASA61_002388 [Batrachochytrium salamandrivorans]|nr:hypothetical protein BASA61_002388 [Batrachochytrium salamandrivorans]KAH9271948.1 hypothetical protein BASA83_005786 [Batrachochytrium salamandrivorans]